MEYANLYPLDKAISKQRKHNKKNKQNEYFPENVIWRCLIHCLLALDYTHSKSVMHRDIKTANILMNYPTQLSEAEMELVDIDLSKVAFKLADFNLSVISQKGF